MLLTRASEYALLSLEEIKKSHDPIGANQLSAKLNIPKSFLAKILQNLAKASILESKKGSKGGFILADDPRNIPIANVLVAAEGKMPHVFDCSANPDKCPKGVIGICVVTPFLANFQKHIEEFLKDMTLEDILNG